MSHLEALLLGIIQGLTEFIPISSTAHLTIAATLMGVIDPNRPEQWTAFMATIQLGTLAAVIWYFRADIARMVVAILRENIGQGRLPLKKQSADARLAWFVVLGTIPIVVVGLLAKDAIEGVFTKDLRIIGSSLIGVAIVLWLVERRATFRKTTSDLSLVDTLAIGLSQCLALIPGVSRSGSTIVAALARGCTREAAARFSFLLSIPAILGAGVLQFIKALAYLSWDNGGLDLVIATVAAAISGYWSIAFLLNFLRSHSLTGFIVYRIAVGLAVFALLASGILSPLP
jgi:undecaprenyl-diphosphatase